MQDKKKKRKRRKRKRRKWERKMRSKSQGRKKINPVNSRDKIGISVKKKGQFWKSEEIRRKDPIALGPNC